MTLGKILVVVNSSARLAELQRHIDTLTSMGYEVTTQTTDQTRTSGVEYDTVIVDDLYESLSGAVYGVRAFDVEPVVGLQKGKINKPYFRQKERW